MVANKSLAEYNLSQEPVLNAKRQQLTAKHQEAIQLVSAVKEIKSELEQKSGKIQPDSLYYLLEVSDINTVFLMDSILVHRSAVAAARMQRVHLHPSNFNNWCIAHVLMKNCLENGHLAVRKKAFLCKK